MGKMLWATAAAGAAALCVHLPASAQPETNAAGDSQAAEQRELATDMELLAALVRRRGEIARSEAADTAEALAFLDRRIVEVARRIAESRSRGGN